MSEISERLMQAINDRSLSYGELSKMTGFPKSALQRYATGETGKIPIDRLEKIANALGVSTAYLMGWDERQKTPTPEPRSGRTEEFVELFEKLDDGAQGYVISSMKGILSEQE